MAVFGWLLFRNYTIIARKVYNPLNEIIKGVTRLLMKLQWFLMYGAMLTPIGFSLLIVKATHSTLPDFLYTVGLIMGSIGILSFVLTIPAINASDNKKEARESRLMKLIETIAKNTGH